MSKKRQRRQQTQRRRKLSSREAAQERAQGPRTRTPGRERREASRRREARIREQEAATGRRLQYRPVGPVGLLATLVWGVLIAGGVLWATWRIGRWGYLGYADSLWLYLLVAGIAVAPGLGWVARTTRDVKLWTGLVVGASFVALVWERTQGPPCLGAGSCQSFGAQGELGWPGVAVAIGAGFALTYLVASFVHGWVADRRPLGSGSTRIRSALTSMSMMSIVIGGPLAVTVLAVDASLRDGPQAATLAEGEVSLECFGFTEDVPELSVRPAPNPQFSSRFEYAVGLADTRREKPEGGRYSRTERRTAATPYEALVGVQDGRAMTINCRFIHPAVEQVTAQDLASDPSAVQQYYPESEVLQPPVDLIPVPQPPGDPEPPADEDQGDHEG